MKFIKTNNISLENATSASKARESEITIYAKVDNINGLDDCVSSEEQVQLDLLFSNGVKTRVRKTTIDDVTTCEYTIKTKSKELNGYTDRMETNLKVTLDYFEGFKDIAETMLFKTRYNFRSDEETLFIDYVIDGEEKRAGFKNVLYQVDVYETDLDESAEYCKIDVEIQDILKMFNEQFPSLNEDYKLTVVTKHLPFKPEGCILSTSEKEEDKTTIASIWESYRRKVK